MKNTVIVIAGPTGTGKTSLSVKLAKKIDAEIISCDSMQVYRGLDIGTAKVTQEEKEGIEHYMTDVASPFEAYSVSDYCRGAKEAAQKIFAKGKIAILAGGTGLYADSFIKDIDFAKDSGADENIRQELTKYAEEKGTMALYDLLCKADPKSGEKIHPNNTKRVIRALEYYRLTGERISEHNEQTQKKSSPYNYLYCVLTRDRQELYERIDKRVDIMMQNGLLCEVWALCKMGLGKSHTCMQALGYKELMWYLEGKCTLFEAVDIIKKESRRYAKRQLTWFGRNKDAIVYNLSHQSTDDVISDICQNLSKMR